MGLTAETLVVGLLLFVGTTVLTVLAAVFIVVRLPEDYFVRERRPIPGNRAAHLTILALKNVAAVVLIAVGLLLSIPGVPGQGFLTIFVGVMLLDFPGKYGLERRLVSRPSILAALNRIRARRGRPPLLPPPTSPHV